MATTLRAGSIYPGAGQPTQETRNVGGSVKNPGSSDFNIPVAGDLATYLGLSLPALFVLGLMAWYLIERGE